MHLERGGRMSAICICVSSRMDDAGAQLAFHLIFDSEEILSIFTAADTILLRVCATMSVLLVVELHIVLLIAPIKLNQFNCALCDIQQF